MDITSGKGFCKESLCSEAAVIAFAGQDVCLGHFFAKCYERLDMLEPMVHDRSLDAARKETLRALLEECSSRTLFICLRHEPLTNLDRSRLMDILSLCGDLQLILRNPSAPIAKFACGDRSFLSLGHLPDKRN